MEDALELFLRAARDNAARPAVVDASGTVTYEELSNRIERLAHAIRLTGAPHPRVAILLPQGAYAYAAMFATLMAGGVYAPINLDHPPQRRSRILSLFQPHAVITPTQVDRTIVDLPSECTVIALNKLGQARLLNAAPGDDLAYVMFTSGSTGEPKGVMIPRTALAHYVRWAVAAMEVSPEDRWSQHPNIAFDLSVLDIYGALCAGAALFPLTARKDRLFPAEAIRRDRLTIWNSVPSAVDLMRRSGQLTAQHLATLRLMTFCGEPLLREQLDHVFSAKRDLFVHNTYGPTEATVSMTLVRLAADDYLTYCESSAALGSPIPGMSILLEGGETQDAGELVIAGPQVGRGYWRDPERTTQAFGSRIIDGVSQPSYRTGDWVKKVGRNLFFVSRIDRQVKRQGNRIELGDIDAALRAAGATVCCTVFVDDQLIAFVEQPGHDTADLSREVRKLLPPYALPNEVRAVPLLPRNANDKIDPIALEAMARGITPHRAPPEAN